MIFKPHIYEKGNKLAVSILPMTEQDAKRTNEIPEWQSSWTSEYLLDPRLEKYAVKRGDELIALGAYEVSGIRIGCSYRVHGGAAGEHSDDCR